MTWTLENMVAALKRKRLRRDVALVLARMLDGDHPEKYVDSFASEIVALLEAE